jgi:hypothetical protein
MKKLLLPLIMAILSIGFVHAQEDNDIANKIKSEKDSTQRVLLEKLRRNDEDIAAIKEKLDTLKERQSKEKIESLVQLQNKYDERLKIIEEAPRTKIRLNGILAFTELLSLQRDIQPANLFLSSQAFFTQLGDVGNLTRYDDFNSWKSEYDKWYKEQTEKDEMRDLINNSVNMIGAVAKKVPLYGSVVQTVSFGISSLVPVFKKKYPELKDKTPGMLNLLMVASQFENQKATIDHEWELINKELGQLKVENSELLDDQLAFYGLSLAEFKKRYLEETLDNKRDEYKNGCRDKITSKLNALDTTKETKGKWVGQVETYMYRVQSLRMRFGQLTNRMLSTMGRYEDLINTYTDIKGLPSDFTKVIAGLKESLAGVKNNFYASFRPEKYIEDSAVMFIEKQ